MLECVCVFGEGGVSRLSELKGPFTFNTAPEGRGRSGGPLPCVPALSGSGLVLGAPWAPRCASRRLALLFVGGENSLSLHIPLG